MYLRYRAKYYNENTDRIEFGFFWAAHYLQHHIVLHPPEQDKLVELTSFFDNNLPIPHYYQEKKNRQEAKSATSWYKDTAKKFINRMNELAKILEMNHIEVERINSRKIPGKKIYEDDYQITVLPYRDVVKKVK